MVKWVTKRVFILSRRALATLGVFGMGVGIGVLLLSFILASEVYEYQDSVDGGKLPSVDAIVCLAGGRGRITAAGDLWYRYWEQAAHPIEGTGPRKLPMLYFSGMGSQVNWNSISKQLRRGVLAVIRPENIVIEKESFNTDANARWLGRYAEKRNWNRILLLTSSYHMKRARYIFEQVLRTFPAPPRVETLSVYQEPFSTEEWRTDANGIRVTVLEYIKWVYYKSIW